MATCGCPLIAWSPRQLAACPCPKAVQEEIFVVNGSAEVICDGSSVPAFFIWVIPSLTGNRKELRLVLMSLIKFSPVTDHVWWHVGHLCQTQLLGVEGKTTFGT